LHLLKVEDYRASKVEPLDGVKERIRETLTEEKAWRLARRKAEEFSWDVKEKGAFPEGGSSGGDFVVKETDYFSRTGTIPGLGQEESFSQVAFSLEPGQMSEVIKGKKGYYILKVIDRKDPEVPPFEEVRDRVEKQVRREGSRNLAREMAEQILDRARSGTSFDELTRQEGIQSLETGLFSRLRTHVPRIGVSEELLGSAFMLTDRDPWPKQFFEVNGKFYVIRLKERKEPTREAFLAENQALRTRQ
jgi:peptidyl-prolyl cis-trans isomerase D